MSGHLLACHYSFCLLIRCPRPFNQIYLLISIESLPFHATMASAYVEYHSRLFSLKRPHDVATVLSSLLRNFRLLGDGENSPYSCSAGCDRLSVLGNHRLSDIFSWLGLIGLYSRVSVLPNVKDEPRPRPAR